MTYSQNPVGVDVSEAGDGSIRVQTTSDGAIISSKDTICLPEDSQGIFGTEIYGGEALWWYFEFKNIDTSKITCTRLFWMNNIGSLEGVEKFNTASVIDMSATFRGFGGEYLDLTQFDTSKVANMSEMFARSYSGAIYVGDKWSTERVTESEGMFSSCTGLRGAVTWNEENANDVTYANWETGYLTYKSY